MMNQAIEQLQQIGFSQYEAQVYISLLQANPMNGYELAKASGIPRSNIYTVLQKLEERGAVLRIDSSESARFAPIDPKELLSRLRKKYSHILESAGSALSEITVNTAVENIMNARGYAVMLDHARAIISSSQQRLLIGIWPEEAQKLSEYIQNAKERGVQITTLCLKGCGHECPNCRGNIFRYALSLSRENRWLVLIADETEVLAGEITPSQEAHAIRTRQKMLVNLTVGYLQNSIALASIFSSLGNRYESLIDRETRLALSELYSLQPQVNWLDTMHMIIGKQEISDEQP
jgi:HTH-type transcriptional regulator, sugar sensing transcriptional regulator